MSNRAVHLASVYRADLSAEELDLVSAQIAGCAAVWIAKDLFEKGATSRKDFARISDAAGKAVTDAANALLESRGPDALHVLLERLSTLREAAR